MKNKTILNLSIVCPLFLAAFSLQADIIAIRFDSLPSTNTVIEIEKAFPKQSDAIIAWIEKGNSITVTEKNTNLISAAKADGATVKVVCRSGKPLIK